MLQNKGKISQIIGPVVDVTFDSSTTELPNIYDSLEVSKKDGSVLVLEVQSHVGEDMVRTISMDSTDGLQRGQDVVSTGSPIQMPTGKEIYGRLFNVMGDSIDGMKNLPKKGKSGLPIHREAPAFDQLSTSTEVLFTGIKVIDLIEPYAKGGKIGLFGYFHLFKAQHFNDKVSLYLIGVDPKYQNKGATAVIFNELQQTFNKRGILEIETNPELVENKAIQAFWKNYESTLHKRRATFTKKI